MVCGANFDISYQESEGSGETASMSSILLLCKISTMDLKMLPSGSVVRMMMIFSTQFTALKDTEPSGNLGVLIASANGMRVSIAIAAFSFPVAQR